MLFNPDKVAWTQSSLKGRVTIKIKFKTNKKQTKKRNGTEPPKTKTKQITYVGFPNRGSDFIQEKNTVFVLFLFLINDNANQ